jgi:hypothetical protein
MSTRGTALAAALLCATSLHAQTEEARTLQVESGALVAYTLRHPADAQLVRPGKQLAPDSALNTTRLLSLHLSTGNLEEAALLSNAPRRRFEELQNFQQTYGAEESKRVFAEYFDPENKLVGEIVIGPHSLLIWDQKRASQIAGQFFVEVDGKFLVDDVPSDARTQLRWVLEAYRAGKIPR